MFITLALKLTVKTLDIKIIQENQQKVTNNLLFVFLCTNTSV